MSSDNLSSLLRRLDELANITPTSVRHGLNKQQRSAPQLPAEFQPGQISVLANRSDPEHPARKYFVGSESRDPEIQDSGEPYFVALVTKEPTPRVQRTKNALPHDRAMQLAKRLAHSTKFARKPFVTIYPQGEGRPSASELLSQYKNLAEDLETELVELKKATIDDYISRSSAAVRTGRKEVTKKVPSWKVAAGKVRPSSEFGKYAKIKAGDLQTEDKLSNIKKRLGDYLEDVAKAIKQGDVLSDKVSAQDSLSMAKTITTDDGKVIQIRGNADDGFRISVKDKVSETVFRSLAEAETAIELYNSRRPTISPDYKEESK